jgi:D-lactate dehydrogenase
MCATACPLSINTGSLVRELRASRANPVVAQLWKATAKNWEFITGFAAMALSTAAKVPSWLLHGPNVLARKVLAEDLIPLWSSDLPRGGTARTKNQQETVLPDLVYFEACVGAMFGSQGQGVALAFDSLIKKAGLTAVRPNEIEGLCCGTPWKSKGMVAGYDVVSRKTLDAVWQASNSGQLPIVCDNSSCTEGLVEMLKSKAASIDPKFAKLVFIDAVDYVSNNVIGNLEFHSDLQTLAVHPTCSSTRLGSNDNLLGLASLVATDVAVPDGWGCCGFAGDRGMLHPELTASATSAESKAVSELKADAHVSCNKTCEIGMSRSTGQQYVHVLELIDQHSTTKLRA